MCSVLVFTTCNVTYVHPFLCAFSSISMRLYHLQRTLINFDAIISIVYIDRIEKSARMHIARVCIYHLQRRIVFKSLIWNQFESWIEIKSKKKKMDPFVPGCNTSRDKSLGSYYGPRAEYILSWKLISSSKIGTKGVWGPGQKPHRERGRRRRTGRRRPATVQGRESARAGSERRNGRRGENRVFTTIRRHGRSDPRANKSRDTPLQNNRL